MNGDCDRCGELIKTGPGHSFSMSGDVYKICGDCYDLFTRFMGWTNDPDE